MDDANKHLNKDFLLNQKLLTQVPAIIEFIAEKLWAWEESEKHSIESVTTKLKNLLK